MIEICRDDGEYLERINMRHTVNEIKEKTIPIAKAYGVKQVSLFGSYARGTADDESDVDLFIEKGKLKSFDSLLHVC